MTKDELIDRLKQLQYAGDLEIAHSDADDALLAYIDDDIVRAEFHAIRKWYA